jgi:hypothetical protein
MEASASYVQGVPAEEVMNMTANGEKEQTCTCGCGATLEPSEFGPVCTCGCEDEQKPKTIAQEIHNLQVRQAEIDRRLHELIEAGLRQPAA